MASALARSLSALRRAGLEPDGLGGELLTRFTADHEIVTVPVEVRERPPMRDLPAYRLAFNLERSA